MCVCVPSSVRPSIRPLLPACGEPEGGGRQEEPDLLHYPHSLFLSTSCSNHLYTCSHEHISTDNSFTRHQQPDRNRSFYISLAQCHGDSKDRCMMKRKHLYHLYLSSLCVRACCSSPLPSSPSSCRVVKALQSITTLLPWCSRRHPVIILSPT